MPRPRVRMRPLARDLEPRVHAVQPRRERDDDAAAAPVHRHRHGTRAYGGRRAGQALELRDRSLRATHPADRAAVRQAVRSGSRAGCLDAGHRRPRARDHVPHRGRPIDGRFLFTLYDTFGFPRDLAEEILVDQGWRVSDETEATWTQEMEAQRERARAKAAFGGDEEATEAVALYQRIGGSLPRPQQFLGYETLTAPAKILAIVADGRRGREAASGDEIEGILDRTPGYAESGGPIGDRGTLGRGTRRSGD